MLMFIGWWKPYSLKPESCFSWVSEILTTEAKAHSIYSNKCFFQLLSNCLKDSCHSWMPEPCVFSTMLVKSNRNIVYCSQDDFCLALSSEMESKFDNVILPFIFHVHSLARFLRNMHHSFWLTSALVSCQKIAFTAHWAITGPWIFLVSYWYQRSSPVGSGSDKRVFIFVGLKSIFRRYLEKTINITMSMMPVSIYIHTYVCVYLKEEDKNIKPL